MLIRCTEISKNKEDVDGWKEIIVAYKGVGGNNFGREIYFIDEVVIGIGGMDLTNKMNLDNESGLEIRVVGQWNIWKWEYFNRGSNTTRGDAEIAVVGVIS